MVECEPWNWFHGEANLIVDVSDLSLRQMDKKGVYKVENVICI